MIDALAAESSMAGNGARITDAYLRHVGALRGYATGRLRDPVAAEDVVHEAFLRLALESRRGQYPSQPGAWLHRVVLNLIISGARRAAVARRHASQVAVEIVTPNFPETCYLAAEQGRTLEAVLSEASPDAQAGLLMASQGYSGREIASALGRSEASTRTMLCRARTQVRRSLLSQEAMPIPG